MEGKQGQSGLGDRKRRERGGSLGNIEDFVRRKRERSEERREGGDEKAFRGSKKRRRDPR